MANFKIYKEVSQLPTVLVSNSIYLIRVDNGFDLYVTDSTGGFAHKINNIITWFDYVIGNTSINETETIETINLESLNKIGISTEIIFKGITYKRFDLNDDSQSFILSTTNQIITKRY